MLSLKDKKQLIAVILAFLTVIFIFSHSLMSPEVSSSESNAVSDVVTDVVVGVIGNETPTQIEKSEKATRFIDENIRKIAHFVEFAVLGVETAFLGCFVFFDKNGKDIKLSRWAVLIYTAARSVLVSRLTSTCQPLDQHLSAA